MARRHVQTAAIVAAMAGLLACVRPGAAGSLEFRSEGFFASPDTVVKVWREPWQYAPHVDVDGLPAITIVGPILNPGYNSFDGGATKVTLDPARRMIVETGPLGKDLTAGTRTWSECKDGMLMRMQYAQMPQGANEATCRIMLPIDVFKGRSVSWQGGKIVLPTQKPDAAHMVFFDDSKGRVDELRIDLGAGRELGIKFLTPAAHLSLSDCRQWNEMNYHVQAKFAGKEMVLFLCVLGPGEAFPQVDLPPTSEAPKATKSPQGASLPAAGGAYNVLMEKSGQVKVQKNGSEYFSVDTPFVKEGQKYHALGEPVSLEAKDSRVEVVTKAADKPFTLRQTFEMDGDGYLSVTAKFEGAGAPDKDARVEISLPAAVFAGKTVRAGERFVELPKDKAPRATLLDDWNGRIVDYDLPPAGAERATVICDQRRTSSMGDFRVYGQNSFKIAMSPRDGVVKYRLRLWKDDSAAPAQTKGNLLWSGASFETGPEGVMPFACHSWNEKMVELGPQPEFDATTAVDGQTSLKLTAADGVKLGNARGFTFVGAVFDRTPLKRDRKYTVSAWMKADRPGVKSVIYCGESTWAGNEWGDFAVTTEWKRYHFTFFTSDFKKSGYYLTWVGMSPDCKQGSLWIDAVQLEEGDLTDFAPAAQVEYGAEVPRTDKLFQQGSPCSAMLRVRNNTDTPLSQSISYVIKDYWEKPVKTGTVAAAVAAKSSAAFTVDLGKLPCGYYRGYFTAPQGVTREIIFGVYQPQPLTALPDDWPLACHNDPSPLVRKLGFGSVRAFEVFEISAVAPQKGKFDFGRTDRMFQQAKDCGLSIMPILSEFRWPDYRPDPPVPPYAQERVAQQSMDGRQFRMAWPTIDAWKDYVRALTAHYKGQIDAWEVMNEPNLEMFAQQYVPYLKAAYEAAKEGNPDCKVVGICATSDFAGRPDSFTQAVLKAGGAKSFDIMSVHLYDTHSPEETRGIGSDTMLQQWRKVMKDTYGRDVPIWHSERSFNCRRIAYSANKINTPLEYCDEPQFLVDNFKLRAAYMIRQTLLDSVAGSGGRFYWFGMFDAQSTFITRRYFQPYGLDHTEFDLSPCPELLAANGLARAIDGMSHPYRQIEWPGGARCVVFSSDKGSVAALWNCKTQSKVSIGPPASAAAGRACTVLDFFGEPISSVSAKSGEALTIELEGEPKYLQMPGVDGKAACAILEKARHN